MYAVIENNNIVAYNKRYSVCIEYINNVKKTYSNNKDEYNNKLEIIKIKNKKAKNKSDFDELYLIRYEDTYIQSGYVEYLSLSAEQIFYDNKYALDVLLKFLDTDFPMSKKDKNHLEHVVSFLYNIIKNDKLYTPCLNDLKNMGENYSTYINYICE